MENQPKRKEARLGARGEARAGRSVFSRTFINKPVTEIYGRNRAAVRGKGDQGLRKWREEDRVKMRNC